MKPALIQIMKIEYLDHQWLVKSAVAPYVKMGQRRSIINNSL